MSIARKTYTLAIRDLFDPNVCGAAAHGILSHGTNLAGEVTADIFAKLGGDVVKKRVEKIRDHFTDQSQDLLEALRHSNDQAWKTLEIALAGPTLLEGTIVGRFVSSMRNSETDRQLVATIRDFIADRWNGKDEAFRNDCLRDLRRALDNGLISRNESFQLKDIVNDENPFAHFADHSRLLEAEKDYLRSIGDDFRRQGYVSLATLMKITPAHGRHLLAIAVDHHFQSAVLKSERLRNKIHYEKLNRIDQKLGDGFELLASFAATHSGDLNRILDLLIQNSDEIETIKESMKSEFRNKRLDSDRYTPEISFTVYNDREKQFLIRMKHQIRALPPELQEHVPELLSRMVLLLMAGGSQDEAIAMAGEVAAIYGQSALAETDQFRAKIAEEHYKAYQAALKVKNYPLALEKIQAAAAADAKYRLWPDDEFENVEILGSGGFGAAFLQKHARLGNRFRVLKSFDGTAMDQDSEKIFDEAHTLQAVTENPSADEGRQHIIRIEGCGFADKSRSINPYITMEHVPGAISLDTYVQRHGKFRSPESFAPIARAVALALRCAHRQGVLHRDVSPQNVLVRKDSSGWTVKLIDFGMAVHRKVKSETIARTQTNGGLFVGLSSGGKIDYAAPEQLDPDRIEEIGPHSDVYGFGKLTYFALFETPNPDFDDEEALEKRWKRILRKATKAKPADRYQNFDHVLKDLQPEPAPPPPPKPAPTPPPKPQPEPSVSDQSALIFSIVSIGLLALGIWFISLWRGNGGSSPPPDPIQQEVVKNGGSDNIREPQPKSEPVAEIPKASTSIEVAKPSTPPPEPAKQEQKKVPAQMPPAQPRQEVAKTSTQPQPITQPVQKPVSDIGFLGQKAGDRKVLKLDNFEIPLRWCPPGTFTMGSPKTDTMRFGDEDQVDVTLTKGFWMMETEVTQAMWEAVMGGKLEWEGKYGHGPSYPAYFVNWSMANDFAAKLTQKLLASGQMPTGMKLALPTEAQWEYACRAGTTTRFPFGEDPAMLKDHAWFGDNSGSRVIDAQEIWDADPIWENYWMKILENGCKSHPVAAKIVNTWGLYDMLGNVWEWCADWYGEKLPGGIDPVGPKQASYRVLRGGSWNFGGWNCRSASRSRYAPDDRDGFSGFRLAAVLAE